MDDKISIYNIAEVLREKTGKETADIEKFIEELISVINDGIAKDKLVKIKGIGTFKIVLVKERESVHVNTGERIVIPAHHKLSFLPDKLFKSEINKPFSFFETIETSGEDKNEISELSLSNGDEEEDEDDGDESEENESVMEEASLATEEEAEQTVLSTCLKDDEPTEKTSSREEEAEITSQDVEKQNQAEESKIEETAAILPDLLMQNEHQEKETEIDKTEKTKTVLWQEERAIASNPVSTGKEEDVSQNINKKTREEEMNENKENQAHEKRDVIKSGPVKRPPQKKKNQSSNTFLYVILGLLLLLLLVGLFYYFYNSSSYNNDTLDRNQYGEVIDDSFALPGDSSAMKEAEQSTLDTTGIALPVEEETASESTSNREKTNNSSTTSEKTSSSEASGNKVIARVKLEPGQRLTLLAQKYYGKKVFWVYIYDFNKSKIPNPDQIPTGMEILIPAKDVYGIDAKSSVSVEKAKKLQSEIISKK